MICSLLLPTRGRPDGLRKTLESYYVGVPEGSIETLLAVDTDDEATIKTACWLQETYPNVRTFIGDRMRGYLDLHLRVNDLNREAKGYWIWIANDDAVLSGTRWVEKLAMCPDGCVHPEFCELGGSLYLRDANGGFPVVPRSFWEKYGYGAIHPPIDIFFNDLCRKQHLPFSFLDGITVSHQRKIDETLSAERY